MCDERTSFGILYSTFSLWIRWWHNNGWYDKIYVFKKRGEEECNLRIHKRAPIIKASILCAFSPRTSKWPKISWSCVLIIHSVGYEKKKYWTVFDCNKNEMLQYYENMRKMLQHWDPNTLMTFWHCISSQTTKLSTLPDQQTSSLFLSEICVIKW